MVTNRMFDVDILYIYISRLDIVGGSLRNGVGSALAKASRYYSDREQQGAPLVARAANETPTYRAETEKRVRGG